MKSFLCGPGYPGRVEAEVEYQLTEDNDLIINFKATVQGKATPINMCNHAYFNLAGHVSYKHM